MKKKHLYLFVLFTLFLTFVASFFVFDLSNFIEKEKKQELEVLSSSSIIKNNPLVVERFNREINIMKALRKNPETSREVPKLTDEMQAQVGIAVKLSKLNIQEIPLYGKIIDQYDNPVSDAVVTYEVLGSGFVSGSGIGKSVTNKKGVFFTDGAIGSAVRIVGIRKEGYEFLTQLRFISNSGKNKKTAVKWADYTEDNPYILNAWKAPEGRYPETSKANAVSYGFKLDQIYSMDFTTSNTRKVKKEGEQKLDLQVLFSRDDVGEWSLTLSVPDGGLIEVEAQKLYMNLAPESGYQQNLTYTGTAKGNWIRKKFYIFSRGRYGRLNVEIQPAMKIGAGLGIAHVMNLEGGRNLEVKQ